MIGCLGFLSIKFKKFKGLKFNDYLTDLLKKEKPLRTTDFARFKIPDVIRKS